MDTVESSKPARVSRRDKNEGHGIEIEPSRQCVNEYKSEYKKRFRPFSQYEYVDGRFFKVKGAKEIPTTCSWYEEVVELRKKTGEYKFRGWGTELGTAVLAPTYAQHLWEQVSQRTSLDALALISSASKDVIQAEKTAAKTRLRNNRPNKPGFPRPHTATPKHPASDLESFKGRKDDENTKVKLRHKQELEAQTKPATKIKGRSQSAEPFSRSPMNANIGTFPGGSRRERSKDKLSTTSERPGQKKHLRPTTLMTSPASKKGVHKFDHQDSSGSSVRKPGSESTDYQDIAKVKTPPEPTRVKSTDQVILKTPDAVNFVVPLNTQQNLIVTQNIVDSSSECNAFAGNVPGSTHMPVPSYNQSVPKKSEIQKETGKQVTPIQTSQLHSKAPSAEPKSLDTKSQPHAKIAGGPSINPPSTTTSKTGTNAPISDTVNGKTVDDKLNATKIGEVPSTTSKDTKIPGKGPRYRVLEDPSVSEDASNSKTDPKKLPEKSTKGTNLFSSAKRGFDKLRYKVKN